NTTNLAHCDAVGEAGIHPIFMRLVLLIIVGSTFSILVLKYADNSLGNAPIAATADKLSDN
ncbi:hypothetical protein, partial [Sinorhizobium sp. BJ1]|uniref:hypothetical protein n=1 Tax=Sinorhizobium sp. BJ1 TaxID=2035455 RepID=UPI001184BD32